MLFRSAPAGVPRDITRRLNAEVAKLYNDAAFFEKWVAVQGLEMDENTVKSPENFAEMLRADREIVGKLIVQAGIPRL